MRTISIILLLVFYVVLKYAYSQPASKTSREDYFETYWEIAVEEMNRTGIPASITLAQGAFESDDGNSFIARNANNHFGIKCRSKWKGDSINYDDDAKNECFRKYNSVLESYKDHSEFLTSGQRYAFLFDLDKTDYKAWAEGLKKAGYATNPKYSSLIIKVIEDNKLYIYDNPKLVKKHHKKESNNLILANNKNEAQNNKHDFNIDNFTFNPFSREIYSKNRVKYIIVKKGDTFYRISKYFDLTIEQLARYNDITADSIIKEGQIFYIEPKRFRSERQFKSHFADPGENLYSISQFYAVRLKSLCRKNNLKPDSKIKPGDKIWLRKRKAENS
jgi:LysM repeat protein